MDRFRGSASFSLAMIGDEIRKARVAAGLTQEELSFRAEVHRTYVSLLERGKRVPTIDVLFRIGNAVGVKASVLIARVERGERTKKRPH